MAGSGEPVSYADLKLFSFPLWVTRFASISVGGKLPPQTAGRGAAPSQAEPSLTLTMAAPHPRSLGGGAGRPQVGSRPGTAAPPSASFWGLGSQSEG